mgnify:CR=1 FL=1
MNFFMVNLELEVNECLACACRNYNNHKDEIIYGPPHYSCFKGFNIVKLKCMLLFSLQPFTSKQHNAKT